MSERDLLKFIFLNSFNYFIHMFVNTLSKPLLKILVHLALKVIRTGEGRWEESTALNDESQHVYEY